MITAVRATEPAFALSESPVWDGPRERVLWVDIDHGRVLEGHLGEDSVTIVAEHAFAGHVGAVVPAVDGSLVVAEQQCLTHVRTDGSRISTAALLTAPDRFNDATCDAAGRLIIGTLSLDGLHEGQRLLQMSDPVRALDDDLALSNGLAFSPDDSQLYSVDSIPCTVWTRSYDHASGSTGDRELLFRLPDGTPDGMCVDTEGSLWIAIWDRAEVRCYTTSGELLETVCVPAPHPTSVAFVGPHLDRILITSERHSSDTSAIRDSASSGSLFLARPGVSGLPTHPWSGELVATTTSGAPR